MEPVLDSAGNAVPGPDGKLQYREVTPRAFLQSMVFSSSYGNDVWHRNARRAVIARIARIAEKLTEENPDFNEQELNYIEDVIMTNERLNATLKFQLLCCMPGDAPDQDKDMELYEADVARIRKEQEEKQKAMEEEIARNKAGAEIPAEPTDPVEPEQE